MCCFGQKDNSYINNWLYLAFSPFFKDSVDTIGNCEKQVFQVGVSERMHTKIKFELIWSSKLPDNTGKKHPCHKKFCAFNCLISGPRNLKLRSLNYILWEITSISKTVLLQRQPFLTMVILLPKALNCLFIPRKCL